MASCNHEAPRAIAVPFVAASRCPIKLLEIRSSYKTGKTPVGGFCAPNDATARVPANKPTSEALRKSC